MGDTVGKPTIFGFQLGDLLVLLVLSHLGPCHGSCLAFGCQCLTDDFELGQNLLLEDLEVGVLLAGNFIIEGVLFSSRADRFCAGTGYINYLLLLILRFVRISRTLQGGQLVHTYKQSIRNVVKLWREIRS